MLGILVPEMEGTVATCSAEGAVDRMEGDGIHRVNVVDISLVWRSFAMTLEAEVGTRVLVLNILNGATSFDTANSETSGIRKAADYPCLPLEW